ncbi:MAG: hydantoinase/oxoprolinase family protein [Dehalococcoidia bacterium]|nr:hydantoinase/oxoprolinase family protein [Dehalococcoidia bacterium]
MADNKKYIIGTDTGGTFTDVAVIDETGQLHTDKASTTPHDFSIGVMDALTTVAQGMGISRNDLLKSCTMFKHGTTVATNAVITRTGSRVGFITTKGFEDTTLIGRSIQRVDGLGEEEIKRMPYITKPEPIVPRTRIRGVYERVDFAGKVVIPLNIEDAREQIRSLVDEEKVEALGCSLLFSWANPAHELRIRELVQEMYPGKDLFISLSHELAPVIREYGRANTVILNCFVGKTMEQYIGMLYQKLVEQGFGGTLMVMQANGGTVPQREIFPVHALHSGPAAGVIASHYMASQLDHKNVVCTDMGGTSFDVALLIDGRWSYAREPIVSRWRMTMPMIDMESIGAGGGTISRVDPITKRLLVGPESAGAYPGPVSYGLGGTEPAITDANLVLGILNPDNFLGGRVKLDKAKAWQAVEEKIGKPLGMDTVQAAAGIYDIINHHMADLIRKRIIKSGHVPEEFIVYIYGGAGSAHAAAFCKQLGVKQAYIFLPSAVFSAFGAAFADIIYTRTRSCSFLMPANPDQLNPLVSTMEDDLAAILKRDGYQREEVQYRRTLHMRYRRQVNYLGVAVPPVLYDQGKVDGALEIWKQKFEEVYGAGTAYPEAGIELVAAEIDAIGAVVKPILKTFSIGRSDPSAAKKGTRQVYFTDIHNKFLDATVYDFQGLEYGNVIEGPAVVEAPATTVLIPPGCAGRVDQYLNLILEL